jgi:NADH-quinone oxidoreductase subunit E
MKRTVDGIIGRHARQRDALIPILQELQGQLGFLPPEAMEAAAKHCRISPVEAYGVASFYAQFKFNPVGKNSIRVCQGTACHVMGGAQVLDALKRELMIEPGETTRDGMFTLDTVACIGVCALAPAIVVNEETHGEMKPEKAKEVLNGYRRA